MKGIMLGVLALVTPAVAQAQTAAQDRVDSAALMRDLTTLSADDMEGRGTGTPGAERARAFIERRFAEIGLTVTRQPFRYTTRGGVTRDGINLVARIDGRQARDRYIVVSAHYDHVGIRNGQIYNGADDNASGVVSLFAIAEALRRRPPAHSVILVAFDAEELGLYGARAFVADQPEVIAATQVNVNLDMLARGDLGELWAAGPRLYPALRPAVEAAAARASIPVQLGQDYAAAEHMTGGAAAGHDDWTQSSDHAPFAAAGVPYVFFSVEDHADYHQPTDDADRVVPAFFTGAVSAALDVVRRLDADGGALKRARDAARAALAERDAH